MQSFARVSKQQPPDWRIVAGGRWDPARFWLLTPVQPNEGEAGAEADADGVVDVGVDFEGDNFLHVAPAELAAGFSVPKIDDFQAIGKELDALGGIKRCSVGDGESQTPTEGGNEAGEEGHLLI